MKPNYIWIDGDFVLQQEADVNVMAPDHATDALVFADIPCYETAAGPAMFRLEDHIQQFLGSVEARGYDVPYSIEDLCETVHRTVSYNKVLEGKVRPAMFLDSDSRPSRLAVAVRDWPQKIREPVRLEDGIPEDASLFMIWDAVIYTPMSSQFGNRISRDSVVTLAKDQGFTIVERPLSYDRLYRADEAFMSIAIGEITPLAVVNGREIGGGKIGPVTQKLQGAFEETLRGRGPRSAEWLDWTWAFVGL